MTPPWPKPPPRGPAGSVQLLWRRLSLGNVHREQIRRRVLDWEELRDVVRPDEELGVVLLDALDPPVLDLAVGVADDVLRR